MADSPQQLNDLVRYAKFAPEGARGHFGVSRAVRYGLVESVPGEQQQVNAELGLIATIETREALARVDEIAAVPNVDLFIGPADLSASLGLPGQTSHPQVVAAYDQIVQSARRHNKKIVTTCPPSDVPYWISQNIDLLFCTNNITCLKAGARLASGRQAEDAIRKART